MQRLFPLVLLSLLAAAVVALPAASALGAGCPVPLVRGCNVGQLACMQVEPVVDTVVLTGAQLGGAVGVGAVQSVLLSSGVNCFPPGPGAPCPLFRVTPAGAVYFLLVTPVGSAADCLAFAGPVYLGEAAGVRYLGGGCGAYGAVNVAGMTQSTPYVYWFCV